MTTAVATSPGLAVLLPEARGRRCRGAAPDATALVAMDLHDVAIQRLFAAGLSLEMLRTLLPSDSATSRLDDALDELDGTIAELRRAIATLTTKSGRSLSLTEDVADVAASATKALGFAPHFTFAGIDDARITPELERDVVAVLSEALSNAARHAHARRVTVDVTASTNALTIRIDDDGVGLAVSGRLSGLENLAVRARRHGGSFHAEATANGTRLTWCVPLQVHIFTTPAA